MKKRFLNQREGTICVMCNKRKALLNNEFCSQCDGYKGKGIVKYGGRNAGVLHY